MKFRPAIVLWRRRSSHTHLFGIPWGRLQIRRRARSISYKMCRARRRMSGHPRVSFSHPTISGEAPGLRASSAARRRSIVEASAPRSWEQSQARVLSLAAALWPAARHGYLKGRVHAHTALVAFIARARERDNLAPSWRQPRREGGESKRSRLEYRRCIIIKHSAVVGVHAKKPYERVL